MTTAGRQPFEDGKSLTKRTDRFTAALGGSLLSVMLSGCGPRGAPSLILFGAFFPAWLLCALCGILAAIGARAVFVASGLSDVLPYQLLLSSSIGLIFAILVSIFWFGQ